MCKELETVAISAQTARELRAPSTGGGRLVKRYNSPSHGLLTAREWDGYADALEADVRALGAQIERAAAAACKRGSNVVHEYMCHRIFATPVGSGAVQVVIVWYEDAAHFVETHDVQDALEHAYPNACTFGRVSNKVTMVI